MGLSETGQLCNDQGGTRGRCEKIVLADGSAVWLKEGSSLRIPEVFAENNRKLSLQGEAFFDVAKNASPCKEKHSLTLQRMLSTHYMFRPIM